jgi:putative phosphoesterase
LQGIEGRLVEGAKLRAVKGNIDGGELLHLPEYISFSIEGFSLLMMHIAGPLGRYTPRLRQLLQQYRPQLLLCGHSHILKVQRDGAFGGMLYVNPGAAGIHGFHKQRTMIRMALDQGKIAQMEVIDMGKRAKMS